MPVHHPNPDRPAANALPDFSREKRAGIPVAGIDEAGRGPLAGPVVAAAVVLDPQAIPKGLDDSKRLPAEQRAQLYETILSSADVGIGVASVDEIDLLNILNATLRAMERAYAALQRNPGLVLVDGNRLPSLPGPIEALVGGDRLSASIAAASIVAKVTRDRMMDVLHEGHAAYGWNTNRGYATRGHIEALGRYGVTPHHRRSFAPVHNILYRK